MSLRPTVILIEDIWEALQKIERYTAGLDLETFLHDEKTVDSVVRNFQIIGEAASRIPQSFRVKHPQIEWTKIVGLRHRIVHEYFGVDKEIIWQIHKMDLPILEEKLSQLRSQIED